MSRRTDALRIYRNNHFYALILEHFAKNDGLDPDAFIKSAAYLINKDLLWNTYSTDIAESLFYLIRIKLIEPKGDKLLYITNAGIEVLQKATFQQLASTSYFNYRTMINGKILLPVSLLSIVVSILALIINYLKLR